MTAAAQIVTKDVYYTAPLRGNLYHDCTARGGGAMPGRGGICNLILADVLLCTAGVTFGMMVPYCGRPGLLA